MRDPVGFLLCDDLIFTSRITGTAWALGLDVRTCRTVEALVKLADEVAPTCVVLDLHHPGLDLPALLAELRDRCGEMPRVVAYGSHVEAATLRAARAAGCDLVLPRSAFVERLPAELPAWLDPT